MSFSTSEGRSPSRGSTGPREEHVGHCNVSPCTCPLTLLRQTMQTVWAHAVMTKFSELGAEGLPSLWFDVLHLFKISFCHECHRIHLLLAPSDHTSRRGPPQKLILSNMCLFYISQSQNKSTKGIYKTIYLKWFKSTLSNAATRSQDHWALFRPFFLTLLRSDSRRLSRHPFSF
jgi:hypothetical protein